MKATHVRLDPSQIPLKQHLARWSQHMGKGARIRSLAPGHWEMLGAFEMYRLPHAEIAIAHVSPFEYQRPANKTDASEQIVALTFCLAGEVVITLNDDFPLRARKGQFVLSAATPQARVVAEVPARYLTLYLYAPTMLSATMLTDINPGVQVPVPADIWGWLVGTCEQLRNALKRDDERSVRALINALESSTDQMALPDVAGKAVLDDERVLAIQAFVDENARDPSLGVDMLCRRFHVSRATLYRQMAHLGGVKRYLQVRRLTLCFDQLRKAVGRDDAYLRSLVKAYQFRSMADFAERYRNQFGVDPLPLVSAGPLDVTTQGLSDGNHIFRVKPIETDSD